MIFYILATLVVCLLTYFCIKSIQRNDYWNERGIKTAPSAIPFIGHHMGLFLKPMRWIYIDKLYKKFKSDEMWGMFELKGKLNLHVTDLDLIRDVTVKEADHFIDRREFPVNDKVIEEFVSVLEGERWKSVRSILTPTFSSGNLKDFTQLTVIAQAELFLLAGFDTTTSAITIIFFYLAKNPSEQEKLRKQLKKILASEDEFNYHNIMECHYLESVVNESLRLTPVAFNIERRCVKDFRVGVKELTIEKGTIISIPAYSIHRDPQYWEEPEAFKPERFLPENKDKIIPFTFMPFGIGPRNCIAMWFAMMEIQLCIAEMVLTFEMRLKPGYEELSFDHSGGSVTKPSSGAVMIDLK